MPRPRSAMRKIREVLRLTLGEGLSRRQVGVALGMPTTTVADHVARARRAGLAWPLTEGTLLARGPCKGVQWRARWAIRPPHVRATWPDLWAMWPPTRGGSGNANGSTPRRPTPERRRLVDTARVRRRRPTQRGR